MGLSERFALMLEPVMIERIDDYRHANRISTRAETVRQLINQSLAGNREIAATGTSLATEPAAAEDHRTRKECCDAANT